MDTIRAMLEEHKLIVICRGVYGDTLLKTMEALYKGGIRLAEVTFDQKSKDYKETLDAITMLEEHFRGRMAIGGRDRCQSCTGGACVSGKGCLYHFTECQ